MLVMCGRFIFFYHWYFIFFELYQLRGGDLLRSKLFGLHELRGGLLCCRCWSFRLCQLPIGYVFRVVWCYCLHKLLRRHLQGRNRCDKLQQLHSWYL